MAFFSRFQLLVLVVVLGLSFVVDGRSGCEMGFGCSNHIPVASDQEEGFRPSDRGEAGVVDIFDWELRRAPSGPDPMHHHDNPKKPRTP